ncbi:WD40 repeat-like protein [Pseudovirgaria hyperparasitica]|uniref:WD40 repeat-like protein n=1 Tax=Pseudovirgaria hyperparasitica TaxID=470096 RepID=A0A6A6VWA1_9PEZI|nr:WD40 repeat-like protein [Pseudovirgaria hyperparasitica]KAF2753920.1 WD40 repeat-like protein [Pseudovirgaria hyperparasitica]
MTPTESDLSGDSFATTTFTSAGASQSTHASPTSPTFLKSASRPRTASRCKDISTAASLQRMDPFTDTVGRYAYAPATKTTVVTTTTTTSVTLPPLIVKAPRQLQNRDPKLYPLAASSTPAYLKDLTFDIGGMPAHFRESDVPEQTLKETENQIAFLETVKGAVESAKHPENRYETPNRPLRRSNSHMFKVLAEQRLPGSLRRKRASPSHIPSIAEAAEIASLHRQHRKQKAPVREAGTAGYSSLRNHQNPLEENVNPTTPDTDAGAPARFGAPHANLRSEPARSRLAHGQQREYFDLDRRSTSSDGNVWADQIVTSSRVTSNDPLTQTGTGLGLVAFALEGSGAAATPPIADADLELASQPEATDHSFRRPTRPPPLDTLATQDASLPSPSLSPITAAANAALHGNQTGTSSTTLDNDDENDVSSLDISDIFEETIGDKIHRRQVTDGILPDHLVDPNGPSSDTNLQAPTLMDIPAMIDSFDAMPDAMKTYVMFQLLRRCSKPTLHFIADTVNPALKCDFLGLLPTELSQHIVRYLNVKSMCRASQVSKKWRSIINQDEKAWKDLLEADGFDLPVDEIGRAVREGWGWQYPHSAESYERDLRESTVPLGDGSPVTSSPGSAVLGEVEVIALSRPKRKATAKYGTKKRRKVLVANSKGNELSKHPSWMKSLDKAQGPMAFADAALLAVPNPNVGLPSLRNLHLYKSLYQRHYLMRKSWMKEDTQPHHLTFRAHGRHVVTCLQFDTDKILTGSDDTHINVYNTKTGELKARLHGHEGGVWALQYEGNILVSGSTDRSVRVWDIEKAKCLQIFQGHTSTVRCLQILKPTKIGETANKEPIMMPKEPLIITGSRDSTLRIWRLPQVGDHQVHQVAQQANDYENPYFIRQLTGHHHSVRAIAAHADTLVSGSYDATVRVWKISTGEVVYRLSGHAQKVYSVVLDHKRNRCISGSMDNLVKVWSLDSGQCLFNLEGHSSLVGLLDLSHDRLVSAAADSTLRIWDPENGQCKSTLSAHTGAITCFQHDDQKVISGSDRTLKMWNVKTGECVKDLLTDLSGVWQVKFNDRRCVAAVQRNTQTYIEVLDFGASRDGIPPDQRGRRIVVDSKGREIEDLEEFTDPLDPAQP